MPHIRLSPVGDPVPRRANGQLAPGPDVYFPGRAVLHDVESEPRDLGEAVARRVEPRAVLAVAPVQPHAPGALGAPAHDAAHVHARLGVNTVMGLGLMMRSCRVLFDAVYSRFADPTRVSGLVIVVEGPKIDINDARRIEQMARRQSNYGGREASHPQPSLGVG